VQMYASGGDQIEGGRGHCYLRAQIADAFEKREPFTPGADDPALDLLKLTPDAASDAFIAAKKVFDAG